MNRIPSLDGLRGISILAVLLGHGWQVSGYPRVLKPLSWGADLGVHCFFVLSGYLITSLLINEYRKSQKISLCAFYKKRAMRLMPVYFIFVFVIALLHFTPFSVTSQGWLGMLTFTANVYPGNSTTSHLWSLAVEQQFYLIWPALFTVICLKYKNNFFRASLITLFTPLALCPISRFYQIPWPAAGWHGKYSFLNQADLLACGCILACISSRYPKELESIISRNKLTWILIAIFLIIIPKGLEMKDFFPTFFQSFRISLSGMGFAAVIAWAIRYADSPICSILNKGFFPKIGTISYSVYVWHMIIWTSPAEFGLSWAPWSNFYLYFIISLITGYISWLLIERPYFSRKIIVSNRSIIT